MNSSQESGRIFLVSEAIHYESQHYGSWSLSISDLLILGERTDDQGPMLDDWFLVFVTSTNSGWHEASVYAEGIGELRLKLAGLLGADSLEGELATSADYASRIIWPAALRGQPLFEFTRIPKPWWRRLLSFGSAEIHTELAPLVKRFSGRGSAA